MCVHDPIDNFKVPEKRFSRIHVDIVGPLPPSCGLTHIFSIIDRTTRCPEAIPLHGTSTIECARALIVARISRFGVHLTLHPTEELNLLQPFGPLFLNSSVVNCTTLLHTIAKPIVWWNASIVL